AGGRGPRRTPPVSHRGPRGPPGEGFRPRGLGAFPRGGRHPTARLLQGPWDWTQRPRWGPGSGWVFLQPWGKRSPPAGRSGSPGGHGWLLVRSALPVLSVWLVWTWRTGNQRLLRILPQRMSTTIRKTVRRTTVTSTTMVSCTRRLRVVQDTLFISASVA